MTINGEACLVIIGAALMLAASQDLQSLSLPLRSSALPEIRQRVWPSFDYHHRWAQEDKISGREMSADEELPVKNWHSPAIRGNSALQVHKKAEKLTAVSTAEYMGTHGHVAYAGFNHHHNHQHHRQGHEQRGGFSTSSYQQPSVTTAPQPVARTYGKHHSGRRVCSRLQGPSSVSHHHRGRQIRLVYTEFPTGFSCCPGWTQVTRLSFGCNKPACPTTCLNGGTCISPGKCTCPKQFTGQQCQFDVDECSTEKPCDQICQNTFGSYQCLCRAGYQLQSDRQSCRKNDSDGTAFEARDLEADYRPTTSRTSTVPQDTENEVGDRDFDKDYEFILRRLAKLEKLVARNKRRDAGATEMSAKINLAVENIGEVKRAVESVRTMQQEVHDLRNKLTQFEEESRKMQHIVNRMTNLESRFRIHCSGSFNGNGRGIC